MEIICILPVLDVKSILLSSAPIVDCHVGDLHSNKGLGGLGT